MRAALLWMRSLIRRNRVELELDRELRTHIDMETEANIRRGMNAADARRAALVAFGGMERTKEDVRDERNTRWLESIVADLRHATRTLRAQRAFTAGVVATLALGVAATTAIFSMVYAVILRPLPYPEPDRIASITISTEGIDREVADDFSYHAWASGARGATAIAAYQGVSGVIQTAAGPREVRGTQATAGYFTVMGVQPMLGRIFTAEESRPGGPRVVLVAEQLWRETMSADSAVLGTSLVIDGQPATVIGVMPATFSSARRAQFWRPFRLSVPAPDVTWYFPVIARLKPGVTLEAFRAELATIQARVESGRPASARGTTPVVMTLHERRYGDTRRPLMLLFAAVGVLLLITCANVANLSLARSTARRHEFALRLALGAGRRRLAQYVLVESFLLSLTGALLGAALAASAIGTLVKISPDSVANVEGIRVDATVLLFTLGIAVVTTLLFGMVPALAAAGGNLRDALASATGRVAGGRSHRMLRRGMVVAELATALVLVVGAGLVARTFWRVMSTPMGFRPESVLTARISLPYAKYQDSTARGFMEEVLRRARQLPGVQHAALVDALPLTGARMTTISSEGKEGPRFNVVGATDGYFETIGARMLAGRFFDANDGATGSRVAVLSADLARRTFGTVAAVGRRFDMGGETLDVVGVADDVRQRGLEGELSPTLFVPLSQQGGWRYLQLAMRTEAPAPDIIRAVTGTVQQLDAAQPAPPFRTMEEVVAEVVAPRRFLFVLLGTFAALAGALAAVGLYGVLAYLVTERTKEIGIRVALGADRRRVQRFMLREGLGLAIVGVAIGLVVSVGAVRLVEKLLYQVSAYDMVTFAVSVGMLLAVATIASLLPARRAARIDPVVALRQDG
ncbi:MAG TPA: ABC transporter permease [Gemmatimonadaceae bacterium]|nr:ABC transporter permease [Gemmatimonadaceae bacterium]